MNEFLTTREAATLIGISPKSVASAIAWGSLERETKGRWRGLISRESVEAYVLGYQERQRAGAAKRPQNRRAGL